LKYKDAGIDEQRMWFWGLGEIFEQDQTELMRRGRRSFYGAIIIHYLTIIARIENNPAKG
jgi:hypothetical protein